MVKGLWLVFCFLIVVSYRGFRFVIFDETCRGWGDNRMGESRFIFKGVKLVGRFFSFFLII